MLPTLRPIPVFHLVGRVVDVYPIQHRRVIGNGADEAAGRGLGPLVVGVGDVEAAEGVEEVRGGRVEGLDPYLEN